MKNKIYLLLIISALLINCSKDSDTNPNENAEVYKLLKRVTYTDFYWGQMNLDFAYSNGLLISVTDGDEPYYFEYNSNNKISGFDETLNFDNKGNLISDIFPVGADSLYYTYDNNGNVSSMFVTDGNDGYTITYVFDGKKNPFNVLWEKYGYYDWGGQSFEPYEFVSCINKQNATKVFKDNILITEANYTYDTDGYPVSCGFIEHLSGGGTREGTVTFTYN